MSITTKPKPGFLINPLHPLSSGLVAWWLFNEGSGLKITNYLTSSAAVGADLHGDIINAPDASSIWKGSLHGGSLYSSASNPQVNFNTNELGNALNGHRGVTVAAWINYDATGGRIITIFGSASNVFLNLNFSGGNINFTVRPAAVTAAIAGSTAPAAGNWLHVAGTCNFTEGVARIYFNGNLVGTDTESFGTETWTQGNATTVDSIASTSYSGYIDDIRLFSRQLSHDEVRYMYGNPYDNILTNRFPKFVQTIQSGIGAPTSTGRHLRRRRLLYTRF